MVEWLIGPRPVSGGLTLNHHHIKRITQKEKSYAYLDHHYSTRAVAARIFRPERDPQFSTHRQCCPHTARDCRYSNRSKAVRYYLTNLTFDGNLHHTGSLNQ